MSETIITGKTRSIGTDAATVPPMRQMTEEQVEAAATIDPDARSRTGSELQTVRRIPRVKTMRRALGLTQEQFAERYHIPLGTLRDWEQGCSMPDQTARAYLKAIAGAPEAVFQALERTAGEATSP